MISTGWPDSQCGAYPTILFRDDRPATKRQTAINVVVANFDEFATQRPLKMNYAIEASVWCFNAADWGRKEECKDTDYRNDN